jgi:hydrogenase nickel incorporation protein HypA/HybF
MEIPIPDMHELSIAQNILDIACDAVSQTERGNVREIRMRIGPYAGIVADSLEFGFSILAAGSEMPEATLAIEVTPIVLACDSCGGSSPVEYGIFACPLCGDRTIRIVSGNELQIVDIQLLTFRQ